MSLNADMCLYVLTLHSGLLTEEELDERIEKAQQDGVSLKSSLCELVTVPPRKLRELIDERARYERRCRACQAPSYVLPGGEEICVQCQAELPSAEEEAERRAEASARLTAAASSLNTRRVSRLMALKGSDSFTAPADAPDGPPVGTVAANRGPDGELSPYLARPSARTAAANSQGLVADMQAQLGDVLGKNGLWYAIGLGLIVVFGVLYHVLG